MSAGSGQRAIGRTLHPRVLLHAFRLLNFYRYAHVEQRRRLHAGTGLRMSPSVSLRNAEHITLGRDVHIGERSCLWAGEATGLIIMGDNALLGPEVFVTASNYGIAADRPIQEQPRREADVRIGADVWLGVRVTVLPGVEIGDGCVIAAGAVVTQSMPAGCIAAGVPARVIGWRSGAAPDGAGARE